MDIELKLKAIQKMFRGLARCARRTKVWPSRREGGQKNMDSIELSLQSHVAAGQGPIAPLRSKVRCPAFRSPPLLLLNLLCFPLIRPDSTLLFTFLFLIDLQSIPSCRPFLLSTLFQLPARQRACFWGVFFCPDGGAATTDQHDSSLSSLSAVQLGSHAIKCTQTWSQQSCN